MNKAPKNSYLPNPARSIRVYGPINDRLANKVALKVARFRKQSTEPITLYIRSNGGHIDALKKLDDILRSKNNDEANISFITVPNGAIRSAAAYLLIFGHYAYSRGRFKLVFHGARFPGRKFAEIFIRKKNYVNMESALELAMQLEVENDRMANKMARSMIHRIVHRFLNYRSAKERDWSNAADQVPAQLAGFADHINKQLRSTEGREVLKDSIELANMVLAVKRHSKTTSASAIKRSVIASHSKIFQSATSCALSKQPRANSDFKNTAKMNLLFNYIILENIISPYDQQLMQNLTKVFGPSLLTKAEKTEYHMKRKVGATAAKEYLGRIATPSLQALWYFTSAISRRLLINETVLRANTAYHLGLVDAVLDRDLTWKPLSWKPVANEDQLRMQSHLE